MILKNIIQKWLGFQCLNAHIDAKGHDIDQLAQRVVALEAELNMQSGSYKEEGLKEFVIELTNSLGMVPIVTYEIIPTIIDEKKVRHFKIQPKDAPRPKYQVIRREIK